MTIEHSGNVHPATVSRVAPDAVKGPRRLRAVPASKSSKVSSRLVADPRAWAVARKLAGGDVTRLRVVPGGAVIVRNP